MDRRQVVVIAGRIPGWSLVGYGFGSGDGDGYGSGYGSGDGDGYGSGYGFGFGYGYGDGSGYGDGDGSGFGFGYGYGDGSGYGDGDGSGDGYGSGYGSGDGSGFGDIERATSLTSTLITAAHLIERDACANEVRRFKRAFPNGARFPEDLPIAVKIGLPVLWVQEKLGLILPITDALPPA